MQADFGTMEKCQNADLTLNSSLLTEYHKIPKNESQGLWLSKDYIFGGAYYGFFGISNLGDLFTERLIFGMLW